MVISLGRVVSAALLTAETTSFLPALNDELDAPVAGAQLLTMPVPSDERGRRAAAGSAEERDHGDGGSPISSESRAEGKHRPRFLFFALATEGFAGMPSDVGFSQNSRFCCNVNALSERLSNRGILPSSMRFRVALILFHLLPSVRAPNVSSRALAALMISFFCPNVSFKMYKMAGDIRLTRGGTNEPGVGAIENCMIYSNSSGSGPK